MSNTDYCYFRDRCELSCDKCQEAIQSVIKLSPTHEVAVTVMQTVRKPDWLANVHRGEQTHGE